MSALLVKPAVPTSAAYLGVDPGFSPDAVGGGSTLSQLDPLESAIGRIPAIVSLYMGWTQSPPIASIEAVSAQGSIPMISWHCGALDSAVAAGQYDGVIEADAETYKAFGKPILLRWFWEMNLAVADNHPQCLGTLSRDEQAAEYVAAYRQIWAIFQHVGATNVAFVWAPSAALNAVSALGDDPPATSFYPCPYPYTSSCTDVDWVGTDIYDRPATASFQSAFQAAYDIYSPLDKPMMITETGAPQQCPTPPGSCVNLGVPQVQWLTEIGQALSAGEFQEVYGIVYVDASKSTNNYTFTAAALSEFAAMGRTGYFSQLGAGIR
jgi:hypothetical protein